MPTFPPLFPAFDPLPVPASPTSTNEIVFGEGWVFDFDTNEFVITPTGAVSKTAGVDTLIQWIKKTIITARFTYPIYSPWYGSEILSLVGRVAAKEAIATEVIRAIRDALLVDPRIKDIVDTSAKIVGDQCYATFTVIAFNLDAFTLTQGVQI